MTVESWSPPVRHLEEADALRANPGVWTFLEEMPPTGHRARASNRANQIRGGRSAAFRPAGHFDAVFRGLAIFVRYVGPEGRQARSVGLPPYVTAWASGSDVGVFTS